MAARNISTQDQQGIPKETGLLLQEEMRRLKGELLPERTRWNEWRARIINRIETSFEERLAHWAAEAEKRLQFGRIPPAPYALRVGRANQASAGPSCPVTSERLTSKKRFSGSIESQPAAERVENFVRGNMSLTEFASQAGTTDRTLRKFFRTGRVRSTIFKGIAAAMGLTAKALLEGE